MRYNATKEWREGSRIVSDTEFRLALPLMPARHLRRLALRTNTDFQQSARAMAGTGCVAIVLLMGWIWKTVETCSPGGGPVLCGAAGLAVFWHSSAIYRHGRNQQRAAMMLTELQQRIPTDV